MKFTPKAALASGGREEPWSAVITADSDRGRSVPVFPKTPAPSAESLSVRLETLAECTTVAREFADLVGNRDGRDIAALLEARAIASHAQAPIERGEKLNSYPASAECLARAERVYGAIYALQNDITNSKPDIASRGATRHFWDWGTDRGELHELLAAEFATVAREREPRGEISSDVTAHAREVRQQARELLDAIDECNRSGSDEQVSVVAAALLAARREEEAEIARLLNVCRGKEEEIAHIRAERDKWLDLFNRSEQFQSGPTKRAEAAEAQLAVARRVCGEAYQLAGVVDAPVQALDNLSAVASDHAPPHKTFLPLAERDFGVLAAARREQRERDIAILKALPETETAMTSYGQASVTIPAFRFKQSALAALDAAAHGEQAK